MLCLLQNTCESSLILISSLVMVLLKFEYFFFTLLKEIDFLSVQEKINLNKKKSKEYL